MNGDLAAMQALDTLHAADVAKVKYGDGQTKNNLLKGGEKTTEMQVNADAKNGLLTTYEAQQKIVEAKRAEGAQELLNLAAMQEYADAIKDPAIIEALKQAQIEAQGLVDTLDVGAQQFRDTFHSSIEGGINDLLNGKFSFKKFFDGISQELNKSMSKDLSDTITNSLFGDGGAMQGAGGSGSMFAGMFGGGSSGGAGIGGMLGKLFGGGAAANDGAMFGAAEGNDDIANSIFGDMLSFDVGADSIPRDMIAQIHRGEMILPADTASRVRSGLSSGTGGGSTIHQENHFHMPQGGYDRRTQDQVAKTAGQAAQRASRRNG